MSRSNTPPKSNSSKHKKKESIHVKEELKVSKYIQEMEEYSKLINDMYIYHIRENNKSENAMNQELKTDSLKKDLDKSSRLNLKVQSQKIVQAENSENKHIFQQIIQKSMDHLIDKKNLYVLTDELTNEEKIDSNRRLEIILSIMMDDKYLINDKTFTNNFNDTIIAQIYLALSPDAKKLIHDSHPQENEIQSFFHHLIGFNYDKFVEKPILSNDILSSINNNIIQIEEMYHQRSRIQEENLNYNFNQLEEIEMNSGNKLIFEEDVESEILKEISKFKIEQVFSFYIQANTNKNKLGSGIVEIASSNEYNSNVSSRALRVSKRSSNSKQRDSNSKLPENMKKSLLGEKFSPKRIIKVDDTKRKFTNFEDDNTDW